MGVIELIFSGTIVIFQKLIYFFALYTFEEIAPVPVIKNNPLNSEKPIVIDSDRKDQNKCC